MAILRINESITVQEMFDALLFWLNEHKSPIESITTLLCPSCGKLLVNGGCPDEFATQLDRERDPNFDQYCRELDHRSAS